MHDRNLVQPVGKALYIDISVCRKGTVDAPVLKLLGISTQEKLFSLLVFVSVLLHRKDTYRKIRIKNLAGVFDNWSEGRVIKII